MRTALAACSITVLLCMAARTEDSPAQLLFNRVRDDVRVALNRVPRYTCVQTITRTQHRPQYGIHANSCRDLIGSRDRLSSPGLLVWHDRLRLDVAVGEKSEMFSWAGARAFETNSLGDLALSGSTGSGSFSSFLSSVFGPDAEGFRYAGEQETSLGGLAAFTYTVPLAKSHYSYSTHDGEARIIPFSGSFYAVPSTAELKRLVVEATQFPSGDVCRVVDTMDYHRVKIGSGDFLLPEVSTMAVLYRTGDEDLNETRYSNCHEFSGESTIRFDDPDEPNSVANVAKAALKALPPKTRIRVRIDPPLNSDTAAAGDPIVGVVEREVKEKGQVTVRTTDRLHGRVLRLEQRMVPLPMWIVAIRFESIERDGVEQPVSFRPVDDGDRTQQPVRSYGRRGQIGGAPAMKLPERPAGAGVFVFSEVGRLVLDQKFHSEWETK
jgi:hypothetical protein